MLPLGPRYVMARHPAGHFTPAGLLIPVADSGHSFVGTVVAVGQAKRVGTKELPLELKTGQTVVYSSRVDVFELEGFADPVDVVEEASVIAVVHDG